LTLIAASISAANSLDLYRFLKACRGIVEFDGPTLEKPILPGCPKEGMIIAGAKIASPQFASHASQTMTISITKDEFLADRQGRTFTDVAASSERPFIAVLEFFNDGDRQRRMEESEIHHDRAPLAGVVRELESVPAINRFLSRIHPRRSQRFRQAVGVLIRIIMERRGWEKTGKKGSLGVRNKAAAGRPSHNTGGIAFWFLRAERYKNKRHKPFASVRQRCRELEVLQPRTARSKVSRKAVSDSAQSTNS
jgi:hypothetical protein